MTIGVIAVVFIAIGEGNVQLMVSPSVKASLRRHKWSQIIVHIIDTKNEVNKLTSFVKSHVIKH